MEKQRFEFYDTNISPLNWKLISKKNKLQYLLGAEYYVTIKNKIMKTIVTMESIC